MQRWKSWIIFCLLLSTLALSGCATTREVVVHRDVDPTTEVVVKRDTLYKLVDELIWTRYQLLECWEKLRK